MTKRSHSILIVEDQTELIHFLSDALRRRGYHVHAVMRGKEAITQALFSPPDLILLDIMMPEMNGYQVCELLKQSPELASIPIIFMSGLNDHSVKIKAFELGGVDYITKPPKLPEVLARIEHQLQLRQLQESLVQKNAQLEQEINQRILAQEALKTSENELRAILASITDMLVIVNRQGFCARITGNHSVFEPASYPLLNQHISAIFSPRESQELLKIITQSLEIQKVLNYEYNLTLSGQNRWFDAYISPISSELVIVNIREITERKQIEMSLEQNEKFLRRINECLPSIIYIFDLITKENIYCNRNIYQVLGYTPEEIKGMGEKVLEKLMHPEDFSQHLQMRKNWEIRTGDEVFELEYRMRQKNGKWCWLFGRETLFKITEDGRPQQILGTATDITERKQHEQELQEKNKRLQDEINIRIQTEKALEDSQRFIQAIINCSPHFLYIYDLQENRNIYSNHQITQSLGYTPQEIREMGDKMMKKLMHPEDLLLLPNNVKRLKNSSPQEIFEFEYRMRHKNGEWRWIHSWDTAFSRDENGKVTQIIGYGTDITEKKLAEEKLRDSQQRLRFLAQQTPVAIIEWNLDLKVVSWNPAATKIFGYDSLEVVGQNLVDVLIIPEQKLEVVERLETLFKNHQSFRKSCQNRRKDGEMIICEWYNTVLLNHQGQSIGGAGIAVDITDQKKAELALQESVLREQTIARTIARMRCTLDLDLIFQTTTSELRNILKSDRVILYQFDLENDNYLLLKSVNPDSIPIGESLEIKQILSENFKNFLRQKIDNSGSHFLAISHLEEMDNQEDSLSFLTNINVKSSLIIPIFCNHQLWGVLASCQNTHPRQWTDQEINIAMIIGNQLGVALQQSELLAQTQKQAAELLKAKEKAEVANHIKTQFLSSMTHELRTPLNCVLGFSQIMSRDSSLTPEQKEYLDIINQSGEHLLELINDILSMSKIESGQMSLKESCFALYQFLNDLQNMLLFKAQSKGLILTFEISPTLPLYIETDEAKLRQILINLLGNAIKFTERGEVTLRVNQEEEHSLRKNGSLSANQCFIHFEVVDTGPGIPSAEFTKIFEPFIQSGTDDQLTQGTGLGLPISKKFIQMMGGDIQVSSELGEGTTFSFEILVNSVSEERIEKKSDLNPVIGLDSDQLPHRILVVEDTHENRQFIVKLLEIIGFDVREATHGKEAITQSLEWKPDLILMDMLMPIMDGYEATRQIKQHSPLYQPVIIAMTASVFEDQRQKVLAIGCDDLIYKPFREETLFEKIGQHLGVKYLRKTEDFFPRNYHRVEELTPNDLIIMSPEWIMTLYQSCLRADDSHLLRLIKEIPVSEEKLINILSNLVYNFNYEIIIQCAEQILQQPEA